MSILIKPLLFETLEILSDEYNINPVFLEKDWYTQQILGIIAGIQSDEFQPVWLSWVYGDKVGLLELA